MSPVLDRRKFLGTLVAGAASVVASRFTVAQQQELTASIILFPQTKYRKINSNVIGVGLWQPPFTDTIDIIKTWFSGTSCRMWSLPDMEEWDQQVQAVQALQPSTILMFLAMASNYQARYFSKTDNNLLPPQQVANVVKRIGDLCANLAANNIRARDGLYWEAWNEPGYPIGGNWKPEDLARYVNDLSVAINECGLPVKVLAPLNQEFDHRSVHWNETYCANLDVSAVGGLVTHYYSHHWITRSTPSDEFLRRAGYGSIMEARVRQDLSYVSRYGRGNWGLHCSEWNIHPPGVTSQKFSASRDMAAALFVFDTIKIFIEQGIASAQFFHLLNDWITSHFGALTHTHTGKNIVHPTGALFGLFHKYLTGNLFRVEIQSPTYTRESDYSLVADFEVPYVGAMGSILSEGHINLLLSNKHSEAIALKLNGENIQSWASGVILRGSEDSADSAIISEAKIDLTTKSFVLPPKSIMVLSW